MTDSAKNKLLGLEILRFFSAVAVLFWHYQHFFIAGIGLEFAASEQPFFRWFEPFYLHGDMGVEVFWCISGFIFFWKYKSLIANKALGGKQFFILRFSRLYPLHLATLIMVALLQMLYIRESGTYFVVPYNGWKPFIFQLFFASDWGIISSPSFNGPIWSISVEVLVYCAFFLALRFIGKSPMINIFIIGISLAARMAHLNTRIFDCLFYFYIGGLIAIFAGYIRTTRYERLVNRASLLIMFIFPLFAIALRHHGISLVKILLVISAPALFFTLSRHLDFGARLNGLIEAAGNMTYSSYLFHFPFQLMFALAFSYLGRPIPFTESWVFITYFAVVLIASRLIYKYFEVPAQQFLRATLPKYLSS